jgi:uncharacterized membrane-anchored protein YitT (DUF2179 family)
MNGYVLATLIYLVIGVFSARTTLRGIKILQATAAEEERLRNHYLDNREIDELRSMQKMQQEREFDLKAALDHVDHMNTITGTRYGRIVSFIFYMLIWPLFVGMGFINQVRKGYAAGYARGLEQGKAIREKMKNKEEEDRHV